MVSKEEKNEIQSEVNAFIAARSNLDWALMKAGLAAKGRLIDAIEKSAPLDERLKLAQYALVLKELTTRD